MGCDLLVWKRGLFVFVILFVSTFAFGHVEASKSEWDGLVRVGGEDFLTPKLKLNEDVVRLLEGVDDAITNRELIHLLNESDFSAKRFSFRTDAVVFLGRWVLHYEPEKMSVVRMYDELDVIEVAGGNVDYRLMERKVVQGALQKKHILPDSVKQVVRDEIQEVTKMPADFTATFPQALLVKEPVADEGMYSMSVPAILTEGHVVYADVYLEMKGKERRLVLKNRLKEPTGAWLPVENHLVIEKIN